MKPTHNTVSENVLAQSAELLNLHLAAVIDLHGQLKQAHWNVRGPTSIAVHELFDKVAEKVVRNADEIAEPAAALGAIAEGTVQVAAKRSLPVPYPLRSADEADEKEHLFAVASTLAACGQSAREAVGKAARFRDADTVDLFTEVSRGVDRQLRFVESHTATK